MKRPSIEVTGFVARHDDAMRVLERGEDGDIEILAVEVYADQRRQAGSGEDEENPFASYDFIIRNPGSAQTFARCFDQGDPVSVEGQLYVEPVEVGGEAFVNLTIDNARWDFLRGIRASQGGSSRNDQFARTEPTQTRRQGGQAQTSGRQPAGNGQQQPAGNGQRQSAGNGQRQPAGNGNGQRQPAGNRGGGQQPPMPPRA